MSDEKKDKGFVVKDRRVFTGEQEAAERTGPEQTGAPPREENAADSGGPEQGGGQQALLPEINFTTFIASLNASALVNLGALPDPATGKQDKNLPLAKQTIDIISMLQEKTAGNLTSDEEHILKNILYDLRMMYVRETR